MRSIFSMLLALTLGFPAGVISTPAFAFNDNDLMSFATVPITPTTPGHSGIGIINVNAGGTVKVDPSSYALPADAVSDYLNANKPTNINPSSPELGYQPQAPQSPALDAINEQVTPNPEDPALENVTNYAPEPPATPPGQVATEAVADCLECYEVPFPVPMPEAIRIKREQYRQQQSAEPDNNYVTKVMRAINSGVGLTAGKNMCWRAVKKILLQAGQISHYPSSVPAYEAMHILPKEGFVNVFPRCNQAGTVLVYRGYAQDPYDPAHPEKLKIVKSAATAERMVMRKFGRHATAGDRYGHIEILGTGGKYHHFANSSKPINHSSKFGPQRRILEGCFIKP